MTSARAVDRVAQAAAWVASYSRGDPLLVVAPSPESGSRVLRAASDGQATFGWQRATLNEWVSRLAATRLADAGQAPASRVVLEGLAARAVDRLRVEGRLGRFTPVGDRPGLPRALARSFDELSLAGVPLDHLPPDLAMILRALRQEMRDAGVSPRAAVLRAAIERVREARPHPLLDLPTLLLDPPVRHAVEADLFAALHQRRALVAVVPAGDATAVRRLRAATGVTPKALPAPAPVDALGRLQAQLFSPVRDGAPLDRSVELLSAPGESRECVEVLRRVRQAAADGVPFDRMAVLVHAPGRYRAHLVEACRRADVPAYFSRGVVEPDPTGRALLALLRCRAEGLSASAFAEYLSLGVVPDVDAEGTPPAVDVPWLPPEDEALLVRREAPKEDAEEEDDVLGDERIAAGGSLYAPWRWERLLVDAAVIGGRDRWRRRLDALGRAVSAEIDALEDPESPEAERGRLRRLDLAHLARFALPLLEALEGLPERGTWGTWIAALDALAARAIRRPARVSSVLRELAPMGPIGPVGLTEVILVLSRRMTEMVRRPSGGPGGKLFVASTEEARGLQFDVVFVPGLAEKVFPRLVGEDPIALDVLRASLSPELATRETRVEQERQALRLAVGAATQRLVLSYPRIDTGRGRPRVPSFYGLEVLRAIEGDLPSFEALAARAERSGGARMAWPAPVRPEDAVDGGEYDLSVLAEHLFAAPGQGADRTGAARYLMQANPHLARALRARWSRWSERWTRSDGLVNAAEPAREVMARYRLSERAYAPTALETFAACPYRFYLRSVWRLSPREALAPVETLDPRVRGRLLHEVQREVLEALRAESALPLSETKLPAAHAHLDHAIEAVGARFHEELAPAIERVFADALAAVRTDLSEWLHRMADRPDWVPTRFELSFGLPLREDRDAASVAEPVELKEGLRLRGAIDLVEQREEVLRATDHKTGIAPPGGGVIRGGTSLQPLLYARALEALFAPQPVLGGRLYYCTSRGRFVDKTVPLGPQAKRALEVVVDTVGTHLDEAFFPAAPDTGACRHCDYQAVCGPAEERRVARKHVRHLGPLRTLRKQS
ncbi:MAG: PD-(D/E)XK nuclease family protein [Sandaracinaceae bacterium]